MVDTIILAAEVNSLSACVHHVIVCRRQICMSGRNVFMGYLDDEQKTREAIDDDGLLHSGDIGRLDRDGFLFVTGRIKGDDHRALPFAIL